MKEKLLLQVDQMQLQEKLSSQKTLNEKEEFKLFIQQQADLKHKVIMNNFKFILGIHILTFLAFTIGSAVQEFTWFNFVDAKGNKVELTLTSIKLQDSQYNVTSLWYFSELVCENQYDISKLNIKSFVANQCFNTKFHSILSTCTLGLYGSGGLLLLLNLIQQAIVVVKLKKERNLQRDTEQASCIKPYKLCIITTFLFVSSTVTYIIGVLFIQKDQIWESLGISYKIAVVTTFSQVIAAIYLKLVYKARRKFRLLYQLLLSVDQISQPEQQQLQIQN